MSTEKQTSKEISLSIIEGNRLETEENIFLDLFDRKITFEEANEKIDKIGKKATLKLIE